MLIILLMIPDVWSKIGDNIGFISYRHMSMVLVCGLMLFVTTFSYVIRYMAVKNAQFKTWLVKESKKTWFVVLGDDDLFLPFPEKNRDNLELILRSNRDKRAIGIQFPSGESEKILVGKADVYKFGSTSIIIEDSEVLDGKIVIQIRFKYVGRETIYSKEMKKNWKSSLVKLKGRLA